MLQFMTISKPLLLNIFWEIFLIYSDGGPLAFLKIANPSFLYNPILLGLYLLPVKLNIKIPESSHTSAPSYGAIVTSKLWCYCNVKQTLCFLFYFYCVTHTHTGFSFIYIYIYIYIYYIHNILYIYIIFNIYV